jgi:hypothetical protein
MDKSRTGAAEPVTPVNPWKNTLWFAALGLAVAAFSCANWALQDYTKPTSVTQVVIGLASVVLCPPTLLFAACIDCEPVGWGGVIMFSTIGILNAALYAVIGVGVHFIRHDRNRPAAP